MAIKTAPECSDPGWRTFALLTAIALGTARASGAAAPNEITWREPIPIASGGGMRSAWRQNESRYDFVDDPGVTLDARGAALVVWVDQRVKDVFFQAYDATGKPRLRKAVNVSRTPRVFSWLPRIAVSHADPNAIYVLWQEIVFSGGSHGGDIFFARSRDGGKRFGAPLNLSRSIGGDGKGRITREIWHNGSLDLALSDDGTLYAAWTEYSGALWFSRSDDGGARFTKPTHVTGDDTRPARAPTLATGPGKRIYLAWTHGEDPAADIHFARSLDGGRTFAGARAVENTKGYSDAPKLAVDARGTVHLAYAESAAGPFDRHHVRYARLAADAQRFERSRDISSPFPRDVESAAFPSIALDAHDRVYVLWETYPNHRKRPRGLAIAYSRDGGDTFSRPAPVPGGVDPGGGFNGGLEGLLMRKLAVSRDGEIAIVNSGIVPDAKSRVWLVRGTPAAR